MLGTGLNSDDDNMNTLPDAHAQNDDHLNLGYKRRRSIFADNSFFVNMALLAGCLAVLSIPIINLNNL